jgi:hypothetical protein
MISNESPFHRDWIEQNLNDWVCHDDAANMKCYSAPNTDFLIVLVWDRDNDAIQFSNGALGLELRMPKTDCEFEVMVRLASRDFSDWPKLSWRKK